MARIEALLEHADWLGQLARKLVGPDAEDVVQETWIRAMHSPADPARSPRPWLAKVLHNTSRMRWRA
jgi:DNA-directed RNA polymerase specialized sigma24 family protein